MQNISSPPPFAVRPPARRDGLGPSQRRLLTLGIVGAHVAAIWALLQVKDVRDAVAQAAPVFVSWVAPEAPKPVVEPPPPEPPRPTPPREQPKRIVAAAPSPSPQAPSFVVPEQVETPPPPAPPAPVVVAAAEPAPPPPPQPKVIPASAVQYLEPIVLEYPRVSRRLGEAGKVLVRVFIDETGHAKNVQVNRSSGHPRLDEAALAAVQKARFKPYTENGQAVAGWAFIPLEFELEPRP